VVLDGDFHARGTNLRRYLGAGQEWAGAAHYSPEPEELLVGIEVGSGRRFQKIRFQQIDRQSRPWPAPGSAPPRGCNTLPPMSELKTWMVQPASPCPGGGPPDPQRNPAPFVPYTVIKVLDDGTRIVDGRDKGCMRVREMGCTGMR
jgi:hypothetical protein